MRVTLLLIALFTAACASFAQEYQPVDVRTVRNKLSVRTGQKITFLFDQRGDRLTDPHVAKGQQSQPALTVDFSQSARGKSNVVITSTFAKVLRFKGAVRFKTHSGFVTTSTNPLYPKLFDMEAYQDPVDEFVLWDIRLTDEPVFR
jgi:hypothetical protein